MSDHTGDAARNDGDLYVITLCTASLPMVLRVPFVHELEGFSVFRSHSMEDGRERFRLYVGYFDSATSAHAALPIVRKYYPAAWISCAPRKNLSSLDDTINTAFGMVRKGTARVVLPPAPSTAAAPSAPPPATSAAPAAEPTQHYVVELDTSFAPVPPESVPQLAVLRAYHLYNARFKRGSALRYALRLGFFKRVHGAQQVAEYLRPHFPEVRVVPVSEREYGRALALFQAQSPAAGEDAIGTGQSSSAADDAPDPGVGDDASRAGDAPRKQRY
jgi:hypothetical protein